MGPTERFGPSKGIRGRPSTDAPIATTHEGRDQAAPATPLEAWSEDDRALAETIAAQEEWVIDVLQRLVRAPTVLGNEEPGQLVVEEALREIGLDPVDVPMDADRLRADPRSAPFDWSVAGSRNVVATWPARGSGGRSLILNGHIDVVPPGDPSSWGPRDPFGGEREGDWIYGRGAADMKCGLAAILGAVRGLRTLGLEPGARVLVESVVEEECTGNGSLMTLLDGYTADAAVVAEPFGAAITTSQVGVLWFTVGVTGEPGHASEAHAANAIESSLAIVQALRGLEAELNAAPPPPYDGFDRPIVLNVGTIRGGDWPSSAPGRCVTECRIAMYPGTTVTEMRRGIEAAVATAAAGLPATAEVTYRGFASEGAEIDPAHPLVTTLAGAVARGAGSAPSLVATTGTTDVAVLSGAGGIPAVCFGPYAEGAHGIGERVYVPSVVETAQVLGLFIRDWCGLSR